MDDWVLNILIKFIWNIYVLIAAEAKVRQVDENGSDIFQSYEVYVVTKVEHLENVEIKFYFVRSTEHSHAHKQVVVCDELHVWLEFVSHEIVNSMVP